MQSLTAACEEAEKVLKKVRNCPLPLSRHQEHKDNFESAGKSGFCIFSKLEELYREECEKDSENHNNNTSSTLLEKLVTRERLNTLVLNLYPDKNEYSFSLQMGSLGDDLNVTNNLDGKSSKCVGDDVMKMPWLPDDELLRYIDNEELPCILVDILEEGYPELFYSGCIIVEVRDHQQGSSQHLYEAHHVLLKPTMQSLWADMNTIIDKSNHEWTEREKLELESQLTSILSPTLCLDPSPAVGIAANRLQHQKQLFNTLALKKRAHKFSLLNRKRKLEAQLPSDGSDLHDFIQKKRSKSANAPGSLPPKLNSSKMVIPAPSLESKKPLTIPKKDLSMDKFWLNSKPPNTSEYSPDFREKYVFAMARRCDRDKKSYPLHIELTILQGPLNSEYLGEIYLDVNYEKDKKKGASSRFTLGSRAYVDKFIQQFTDVLTEKKSKSVNITKYVTGQPPILFCISGIDKNKAVVPAQQAQAHAAQQAVQAGQVQVISTPRALTNPGSTPGVVLVQGGQSSVQNNAAVTILQAQLQSNGQPKLEAKQPAPKPEAAALLASVLGSVQPEPVGESAAAAAKSAPSAAASNTAILSLLNTSPVNSMNSVASAAVANAITNSNSGVGSVVGLASQQTVQSLNQKVLGRKMMIANVPRVLNHGNVITVNNGNAAGAAVNVPQQVRISALASQLASPPVNVIIATANTSQQQQGQTFTLTTVPSYVSYTTVPLSSVSTKPSSQAARLMAGVSSLNVRGLAKPAAECGVSGLSALLVNTPAADHPMPGANNASALLERLTASSCSSPAPTDGPAQFTVQSSKGLQQVPVQLAPVASPPGSQTLNVHTLNLAGFQGTLNNLPAIQNVQMQIPRLSSPLGASSAAGLQAHSGLIYSVVSTAATTCTSGTQQANSIATSSLGSNASAVVITNTAAGATSPVLPLPLASGMKGFAQHGLRVSSPNTVSLAQAGKSVQLVGTLPRASQLTGVKQTLTARGLLQTQRMTNTPLKMATSNATTAQMANAALAGNVASNSVVSLTQQQQQQLQLTLQKQAQYPQYHELSQQQLQGCLPQQQQKTLSPAAIATKHHRRSNAADPNK